MAMKRFPITDKFDSSKPPIGFVELDEARIPLHDDWVITIGGVKHESGWFEVKAFAIVRPEEVPLKGTGVRTQ